MAWRSVYNVSRATGADVTLSVGPAKQYWPVPAIRSDYFIGDVNTQMENIAEDVNDKELELAH